MQPCLPAMSSWHVPWPRDLAGLRRPAPATIPQPADQACPRSRRAAGLSHARARSSLSEGLWSLPRAGGGDMNGRSLLGGLASAAGLCFALCCSIACGQGLPAPAAAAIVAAPVSAESNACKPPEHGRISCKVVCDDGYSACGDHCTKLESGNRNCGACGNNCSLEHSSSACKKGQCDISSCHPGWANCDGNVNNGCETHLD